MNPDYLPLAAYSAKYSVSISTLRRRIKADDLVFLFEDGKYLIYDQPLSTHQRHRPSQAPVRENSLVSAHTGSIVIERAPIRQAPRPPYAPVSTPPMINHASRLDFVESSAKPGMSYEEVKAHEEKILQAANKLLTELKQAYTQMLSEKDLQILKLQQEVADLQTLVSVLEKIPGADPG